ncbi:hypothetical protein V2J09_021538 [Rumex salicifolius]
MGKIAVVYKNDCPFKILASWHHKEGCILVKSITNGHNCVRNMQRNCQLTSTWLAKEYLDRFKESPYWQQDIYMLGRVILRHSCELRERLEILGNDF